MNERAPSSYTVTALGDPTIEPGMLGRIAGAKPDLRMAVLAHPNCSPDLAAWIQQQTPDPLVQGSHTAKWMNKVGIALAAPAFIGLLGVFLPLCTTTEYGKTISLNYFSPMSMAYLSPGARADALSLMFEGLVTLGAMLTVIAIAIILIVTHKKWARITAGVIGIVVGFRGMTEGVSMVIEFTQMYGFSTGSGAALIACASILILLAGIIALLPARRARS